MGWGMGDVSSFGFGGYRKISLLAYLIRHAFRTFPEKLFHGHLRSGHRTRQLILPPESFVMLFSESNMFSRTNRERSGYHQPIRPSVPTKHISPRVILMTNFQFNFVTSPLSMREIHVPAYAHQIRKVFPE